jgi:hypothetical protein
MMRAANLPMLALACATLLGSCARVKPWQRDKLAGAAMQAGVYDTNSIRVRGIDTRPSWEALSPSADGRRYTCSRVHMPTRGESER